jgi:hypothetical protein
MLVYLASFTVTLLTISGAKGPIFRNLLTLSGLRHSIFLMRPIKCTVSSVYRAGRFVDLENMNYFYVRELGCTSPANRMHPRAQSSRKIHQVCDFCCARQSTVMVKWIVDARQGPLANFGYF